jgi:hypothetical protein
MAGAVLPARDKVHNSDWGQSTKPVSTGAVCTSETRTKSFSSSAPGRVRAVRAAVVCVRLCGGSGSQQGSDILA